MDIELLHERARIIKMIREFFDRKQYLEVDTPLLSPDLIPESCLEVFETHRFFPYKKKEAQAFWLIPSPEIWMKKLISKHKANMFQICKCFRNGETKGHLHNPEFTMLEYYTMDADYLDSMELTEELFLFLASANPSFSEQVLEFMPPFERISIEEAFKRWAGFDLFKTAEDKLQLEKEACRLGIDPKELKVGEIYDLIFIHCIEPNLPKDKPVFLMDYPAFVPCLAKKQSCRKKLERWELYLRGIELANCYSEETDANEVKMFIENEKKIKENTALVNHKVDENYWKFFCDNNFPECSGAALGLDRLIMAFTGHSNIENILPFPM